MIGPRLRAGIGGRRAAGRSSLPFGAAAALTVTLALVGCGSTVIDAKKAREAVGEDVERKTGVEVRSVSCPSGVEIVPGDTFSCRVVAVDGRTAEVELRIRNFEADVETVSIGPAGS